MRKTILTSMIVLFVMATTTATMAAKIVDFDAGNYANGSAVNSGTLGGTFTASGTAPTVGALDGKTAVTFNGSGFLNSDITSPASMTTAPSFTVATWVYGTHLSSSGFFFGWATQNEPGSWYGRLRYSSAYSNLVIDEWPGPGLGIGTPTYDPSSNWHHLAVTFDATTGRNIYVDGVLSNSDTRKGFTYGTSGTMKIGSDQAGGGRFTGSIASLQIYNTVMSETEISNLYQGLTPPATVNVSGTISDSEGPVSGANIQIYSATLYRFATTSSDGTYSFAVTPNDTYYMYVSSGNHLDVGEVVVNVAASDVTKDITLARFPNIYGSVKDDNEQAVVGATVTVEPTVPDDEASQQVITDASGNYRAYVAGGKHYNVSCTVSRYAPSAVFDLNVGNTSALQDIILTRNAPVKYVELDASTLTPGINALSSWTNTGALGGSFDIRTTDQPLTVESVFGKNAVRFEGFWDGTTGGTASGVLDSSWKTSDADLAGINAPHSILYWICIPYSPNYQAGTVLEYGGGRAFQVHGEYPAPTAPALAPNVWHLVAFNYNGSTEKMYIDGALLGTAAYSATWAPGAKMRIGHDAFAWSFINAYVSEVEVWDQAISEADLLAKYNAEKPTLVKISGTVSDSIGMLADATVIVNTSTDGGVTLTPVTSANTGIEGTYVAEVYPGNTYYLVASKVRHTALTRTVAVGTSDVTGQNFVLALNAPVKQVDLDASTLVLGTNVLSSWQNAGALGGAFDVVNTGSPNMTVESLGGKNAVRFEGWWDGAAGGTTSNVLRSSWTTSNNDLAGVNAEHCIAYSIYVPNAAYQGGTVVTYGAGRTFQVHYAYGGPTSSALPEASWHTIVFNYDGINESLYVDGNLKDTVASSATWAAGARMLLGHDGSPWSYINAGISRVVVYDQHLSETGIRALSQKVAISGKVTLKDGATPAAGAVVGIGTMEVTAGSDGTYIVAVDPNQTYSLTATFDGRASEPVSVAVATGDVTNINLTIPDAAPSGPVYGVNNKAALTDAKLVGKSVKVWGKVISISSGSYVITDGYSAGVTINGTTTSNEGDMVVITGLLTSLGNVTP